MDHCEEYFELLSAALDGELSPEERDRLLAHLETCPSCRELGKELSVLQRALEKLPVPAPPPTLTGAILDRAAQLDLLPPETEEPPKASPAPRPRSRHSAPQPWGKWAAAAAMLAVVVLGGWGVRTWFSDGKGADMVPSTEQAVLTAEDAAAGGDSAPSPSSSSTPHPAQTFGSANMTARTADAGSPSENKAAQAPVQPESSAAAAPAARSADVGASDAPAQTAPSPAATASAPTPPPQTQAPEVVPIMGGGEPETPVSAQAPALRSSLTISETADSAAPAEDPAIAPEAFLPDAQNSGAPDQAAKASAAAGGADNTAAAPAPTLSPAQAMDRMVERCFGGSGYEMVREDHSVDSCHVSLTDGETVITGGTIERTGEDQDGYFFDCHWDDGEESYHYTVRKLQGDVIWEQP